MPIAISAEQRALQASIRDWAERAGTLALVRGLEPGSRPEAPGSPAGPPGSPARPADVPGPSVSRAGDAVYAFLLSRCLSIAGGNTVLTFGGGVNEIQRELIATAGLGLPRVPR